MEELVYAHEGRLVTDSLRVAEASGKMHKNVLRDIRKLDASEDFTRLNFEPCKYRNSRNVEQDKFLITEEGLNFLAMGYSGEFREKLIKEFARMASVLNRAEPITIHALFKTVQALVASQDYLLEQMIEIEEKLESQITLNSRQQRILQQAITQRVHLLETDATARRSAFQKIHRDIKDGWEIASYRDVALRDFELVLGYVEAWLPGGDIQA